MRKLIVRFSALVIIIVCAASSIVAQTYIGRVVEIEGTWALNGSNTLSRGEKLPSGGSIRRQSSSSDDYITIADTRGGIIGDVSRNCRNENCSRVIILPRRISSNSLLDTISEAGRSLFNSVMEKFTVSSPQNESTEVRSGSISENVVKLTDDKIDLSLILKIQGEQYLRRRVISLGSPAGDWTKPEKLDRSAIVSGFQPGLYEINLVRSNGSNFEPVASAWILAAAPASYEKTQASFQEMQKLTETWGDKVNPETKRSFLRASLDTLAQNAVK